MIQLILYTTMLITSIMFMQMNHPLAMGLTLLVQTLLTCLSMGVMAKSFWFSYMLFLVFLGGMLVVFIYVTSLASNEMFSLSMKLITTMTIIMAVIGGSMLIMDKNLFTPMVQNNEMDVFSQINLFSNESYSMLNKMYNYPTNLITIMMMVYLLITLIAIVKITNIFYGPLRQMN